MDFISFDDVRIVSYKYTITYNFYHRHKRQQMHKKGIKAIQISRMEILSIQTKSFEMLYTLKKSINI
jgi:hypothetical protein